MFTNCNKIPYLVMLLFYIIMPLYMFLFSNDIRDYAIATFILILGLLLNYVIKNKDNKKVQELLQKWF